MSLNKILVIGNLGSDPEMRYMPSGDAVTNFSVAASRRYNTRDGQQVEETEWFRVSAWGRLAEQTNQYLSKGRKVYVEGRLSSRTWQGQDGQARFSNEINASQVVFLDSGGRGQTSGAPGEPPSGPPDDDDELPW
jgi:single-strand DNA-binding protein